MTDNEIIKALECCNGWDGRCLNCPLNREGTNCKEKLNSYALVLINRQKAEIEMLKDLITYQKQEIKEKEQKYNQVVDDMFGLIETTRNEIAESKSEAIKKFAERSKETISNAINTYYNSNCGGYYLAEDVIEDIDNLVKEMTEVSE